ncbi:hypothetical protein CR513_39194, partial [Mucuna pruriens]
MPSIGRDASGLVVKGGFRGSFWDKKLGEKLDKFGKGLDSVQKDNEAVNAKVEALSKWKEERPKITSMCESEGSYAGDNLMRVVEEGEGAHSLPWGKDLKRLHQGPYSVEEYHKEMEMDMLRAQIKESEEAKRERSYPALREKSKMLWSYNVIGIKVS